MPIEWIKTNKIGLAGLGAGLGIVLNIMALKSPILGLILSVFWLTWLVYSLKNVWGQKRAGLSWSGSIALLAVIMIIIGSVFFYLGNLSDWAVALIVLMISIAGCGLTPYGPKNWTIKMSRLTTKELVGLGVYLIFYILSLILLWRHQSVEAIRTPWEVVPKTFFALYFILTVILVILFSARENESRESGWPKFLIGAHFLLSLSVATIVYKIGFGFDPFVHRTAEKALTQLGYIDPKPLYYVGQYSLVTIGAKILQTSIEWLDKLLVPFLAVLTLPGLASDLTNQNENPKLATRLVTLATVLSTTPLFFYTVPQSLANLLLLILILASWKIIRENKKIPLTHWLILVAIFFIHPLSAVPGAIWLIFWNVRNKNRWWKTTIALGASVSIPVMFFASQILTKNFGVEFGWANLSGLGQSLAGDIFNYLPFYSIYHLIYLYRFNILLIVLALVVGGILIQKNRSWYLVLIGALATNLFLMGLINFKAIIAYEQVEFIRRLIQIMFIMVFPLFGAGLALLITHCRKLKGGKLIIIFWGALVLTFSLYLAYPRDDAFNKGRSYAVSRADLSAVNWIDENAGSVDYVVLANQSVSAAGLQEFGFRKYYNIVSAPHPTLPSSEGRPRDAQQIFYYPIPTSSPLYEIYLDIIYNGVTSEKIQKARDLTGASKVYVVVNGYWLDAKKRVAEAKLLTDNFQEIEGKVWVFGW